MTAVAEEPGGMSLMSRVERLNLVLSCLEEMKSGGGSSRRWSSGASSTSSGGGGGGGMMATDGRSSSVTSSPKIRCRSMEEMIAETRLRGSLIDRITGLESRLLMLEEEVGRERKSEIEESISPRNSGERRAKHKKGLRSLVRTCVGGDLKTKD